MAHEFQKQNLVLWNQASEPTRCFLTHRTQDRDSSRLPLHPDDELSREFLQQILCRIRPSCAAVRWLRIRGQNLERTRTLLRCDESRGCEPAVRPVFQDEQLPLQFDIVSDLRTTRVLQPWRQRLQSQDRFLRGFRGRLKMLETPEMGTRDCDLTREFPEILCGRETVPPWESQNQSRKPTSADHV